MERLTQKNLQRSVKIIWTHWYKKMLPQQKVPQFCLYDSDSDVNITERNLKEELHNPFSTNCQLVCCRFKHCHRLLMVGNSHCGKCHWVLLSYQLCSIEQKIKPDIFGGGVFCFVRTYKNSYTYLLQGHICKFLVALR